MILIVGATGRLGGLITKELLARGHEVRILLRRGSAAARLAKEGLATDPSELLAAGALPAYGDLKEPATIKAAVAGATTVITTANSAARGEPDTLDAVDRLGTSGLIDAAVAAGAGHFVYLSALHEAYASAFPLLAAKLEIEAYLKASGLHYTILCPGMFMESWIAMVIGQPLAAGVPVSLPIDGRRRHHFVAIRDVAAYAVGAADNPAPVDQTVAISGPSSLSYCEVTAIAGRALGREIEVDFITPGQPHPLLGDYYGRLLTEIELSPEVSVDMSETARHFGIPPTPFEQVAYQLLSPFLPS